MLSTVTGCAWPLETELLEITKREFGISNSPPIRISRMGNLVPDFRWRMGKGSIEISPMPLAITNWQSISSTCTLNINMDLASNVHRESFQILRRHSSSANLPPIKVTLRRRH
jgi:hypothetical protein